MKRKQLPNNTLPKEQLFSILSLVGMLTFYLFFAFYDGAVICVDSPTYINMSFAREPFYPILLAFFRLFSVENYLLYVVILQSLLMALFGWLLADYLRKAFDVNKVYSIVLYLLPIGTSLLCRFAAKRSSMYTNSIMTEGICTSLYLFFIYCVLKYLWEQSRMHIILAWITAFIMISCRKQMLMVLPIFIVSVVLIYEKTENGYEELLLLWSAVFLFSFPLLSLIVPTTTS